MATVTETYVTEVGSQSMLHRAPSTLQRIRAARQRLMLLARTQGVRRALYHVAARTMDTRWWPRCLGWCVVEVHSSAVTASATTSRLPRAMKVRRATREDLPALEEYFDCGSHVRRRFERGDTCLITVAGDEICAGIWLAVGPTQYEEDWEMLRCRFVLPPGSAWTYDGKGTRLGAWGGLMAQVPQVLLEAGVQHVYTIMDYNNRASIEGHKRLGYRSVGFITCLRACGAAFRLYRSTEHGWSRLPGKLGHLEFD